MPIYHYKCFHCGDEFEIRLGIKEDKLKTCKECGADALDIVLDGPFEMAVKEVKTLGQLAEKNAKAMGKEQLQKKMESDGVLDVMKKKEKMKEMNKLAKLSPEKKVKYIETGKL
jgi:putative FmdB family regulatory protein